MDPKLSSTMQELIQNLSLKENTIKDYKRLWGLCYQFFENQSPPVYPPYTPHNVINYLEELWRQKVGKTTPAKVVKAINFYHQTQGHAAPGETKQVIRAVRAVQSDLPNKGAAARRPLSAGEKNKILNYCLKLSKTPSDHWRRNFTIYSYAIACGGRMKDIVRLKETDVKWVLQPNIGVKAHYSSTKTDPIFKGQWQNEYTYQDLKDPNDGVKALLTFMKHTMKIEKRSEPINTYIFKSFHSEQHISDRTLYTILKKICTACRINSDQIGNHSFRKTCATELYEKGASFKRIRSKLGHTKNSLSTKRYVFKNRK